MSKPTRSPHQKAVKATGNSTLVNEGESIPITILSASKDSAGNDRARIELNLADAPAPRRRFAADAFTILARDDFYHLIFMQRRVNGSQIRAMVDIHMTIEAVVGFASSVVLRQAITDYSSPFELATLLEPEQTVTLAANYARVASGPNGACIDFYLASQFSVTHALSSNHIHLEGEVRIITSQHVFEGFFRALLEMTKSLRAAVESEVGTERKIR
jgi:hypothetical protein